MITKLKPYPAYKESGMPWLGQVPEHWEVLPGRAVFREINDRGHPDEQMLSVTITRGVLRQADLLADSSKKDSSNEDKSNYKLVQPGDLVYNKMRAWQGAVGVSAYRGIVSPAYIVQRLRSAENLPRYMHFLLRTPLFASEAERWSYGITSDQWSLRAEEFKCIYFSLPPLPEQTAIVRFLDWAEQRIRRVIRARQRRIKLLEEYKQALIHQAVTGSIDVRTGKPYPAYKDSGVEWLGQVPEHWEVVPLCGLGRPKKVTNCVDRELLSVYLHRGVIRFSDVPDKRTNPTSEDLSKYQAVDYGDFVLNNQQAWRGSVGVSKYSGIVSPAYLVLALNGRLDTTYADRLLQDRSMVDQYLICSKGVGSIQRNLYWPHLRRVAVPVPPNTEQNAIVLFLDTQTTKIDTAIAAARREIELLREYRTRLIADVVTGKVDVREVAAQLPEEPPEEEAESIDTDEIAEGEATDEEAGTETVEEEEVEP
jgi:type I restriction enzyme S subunit